MGVRLNGKEIFPKLTHIRISNINQNGGENLEVVDNPLIELLYTLAYKSEYVQNKIVFSDNNDDFSGTIQVNASYSEYIDYLTTFNVNNNHFYPHLNIMATTKYILFEDDITLNTLLNLGIGDGVGISEAEAAEVNLTANNTKIGGTPIEYFNEFKYFTGCGWHDLFKNCTSLKEVTMPYGASISWDRRYWDHSPFNNCKSLIKINWNKAVIPNAPDDLGEGKKYHGLFGGCSSLKWYDEILPPGCDEISDAMFQYSGIDKIIVPEGVTYVGSVAHVPKCIYAELSSTVQKVNARGWGQNMNVRNGGTGELVLVCKAITPPTLLYVDGYHDANTTIYVPDESLDTYLNSWSNFPRLNSINRLSQLPEAYKEMGTIE